MAPRPALKAPVVGVIDSGATHDWTIKAHVACVNWVQEGRRPPVLLHVVP